MKAILNNSLFNVPVKDIEHTTHWRKLPLNLHYDYS